MRRSFYRPGTGSAPSSRPTAAPTAAVLAGGRAKQSGRHFEQHLEVAHQHYDRLGLGYLTRLHPPVIGPPDALRYSGPADCDYMGWLHFAPYTWAVAYDAKHTDDASFALPTHVKKAATRRGMLRQIDHLIRFATKPQTVAFYLVGDLSLGFAWFLFPDQLAHLRDGASVPLRTIHRATSTRPQRIEHHQPVVALSSIEQQARGQPLIDWRIALAAALGLAP